TRELAQVKRTAAAGQRFEQRRSHLDGLDAAPAIVVGNLCCELFSVDHPVLSIYAREAPRSALRPVNFSCPWHKHPPGPPIRARLRVARSFLPAAVQEQGVARPPRASPKR